MKTRFAIKIVITTVSALVVVALGRSVGQAQSTTFYVSNGTNPDGDLAWQATSRNVVKSCRPTRHCAAACMAPASSGAFTCHTRP